MAFTLFIRGWYQRRNFNVLLNIQESVRVKWGQLSMQFCLKSKKEDRKTEKNQSRSLWLGLIVKNGRCNYKNILELICILHDAKEPRYQFQWTTYQAMSTEENKACFLQTSLKHHQKGNTLVGMRLIHNWFCTREDFCFYRRACEIIWKSVMYLLK